jgi:hypothetical protein
MRQLVWAAIATACVALVAVAPAASADYVYLTDGERARVVALVRSDPRIRATIGDAEVQLGDVLPWSADGTRETLMGGGVTLAFDSPRDVEADWPLMDFPKGPAEYTITTLHYRVQGADAVDAWVDFRKDRVVSFDVLGGTVDESTIREVAAPPSAKRSRGREERDGPHGVVAAALGVASLLGLSLVLGHRYGRTSVT